MSELEVIQKTKYCHTKTSMINDLKKLGIKEGDILLVHSSLSQIGWVVGREVSVVEALIEVVGKEGAIVMPTFSGDNSNPEFWGNPPVPKEWIETIKENMPPFDPKITPTREMGKIVDCFRNYPGVLRSYHPQVSFAAYGKYAQQLTENHQLDIGFGKDSPLYRLYEMNAKALLLGVSYGNCTCMHLAEVMNHKETVLQGARIYENGVSIWKEFKEIEYDDEKFLEIGTAYEKEYPIIIGKVGNATTRLLDIVPLVEYTKKYI